MDSFFDDDVDEVGAEIEAFCPKCKADTAHVVMSKYEDEIRRVQCNPCGDVHSFRKPRGDVDEESPEPLSAKKRAIKAKPTWEQMMAKAKKEPRLYLLAERYVENELLTHPKFGTGFVSEVIDLDKIEVTFEHERRVLIHNKKGMSLPPAAYAHAVDATVPIGKNRRKALVEKAAAAKAAQSAVAPAPKKPAAKTLAAKTPEAGKPARPAVKKPTAAAPTKKPAGKKPAGKKPARPQPKAAARPQAKKPTRAQKKPARPARPAKKAKPAPARRPAKAKPAARKPAARTAPRPAKAKARAAAPARSKAAKGASRSRPAAKKAKKR